MDVAEEVHAPDLRRRVREAELGERDPELRGPAEGVALRRHVPDRVPALVPAAVVVAGDQVALHAEEVHTKLEARAMVVVRIDVHLEEVRLRNGVTPAELGTDARRLRVEHPRCDVDGVAVVRHPDLRPLGRRIAVPRRLLDESGDRRRRRPGRVVQPPVNARRAASGADGHEHRDRAAVRVAQDPGVGGERRRRRSGAGPWAGGRLCRLLEDERGGGE